MGGSDETGLAMAAYLGPEKPLPEGFRGPAGDFWLAVGSTGLNMVGLWAKGLKELEEGEGTCWHGEKAEGGEQPAEEEEEEEELLPTEGIPWELLSKSGKGNSRLGTSQPDTGRRSRSKSKELAS